MRILWVPHGSFSPPGLEPEGITENSKSRGGDPRAGAGAGQCQPVGRHLRTHSWLQAAAKSWLPGLQARHLHLLLSKQEVVLIVPLSISYRTHHGDTPAIIPLRRAPSAHDEHSPRTKHSSYS